MSVEIKRMNITEFRQFGYLQELNRQFLHPLGLALETITHPDNTETLGGIWDYREDPEGVYFEIDKMDKEIFAAYEARKLEVQAEQLRKAGARKKALGFLIEPVKRGTPKVTVKK